MTLNVTFGECQVAPLDIVFEDTKCLLSIDFGNVTMPTDVLDYYEGEYEITPKVEAQTLPIAKKTMKEDLTVKAIPVFNVGNNAGGSTFYIATMD